MFPHINSRQSFPALEQEMLAYWKANNTFKKSLEIREWAPEFNFYDGPPFATGTPHYGHLLAGTIKDVIPRYQTMQGKFVERRFGWDCHGLPIENIVEKKLGISGKKDIEEKIGVYEFNEECRRNVFTYVDDWRQTVERMGRWVDMDNDYKTMDADYMESVWWVFKNIYDKGYVYESYRVVPYCTRCSTSLSNFEVNQGYEDRQDKAVTVKFKIKGNESKYILAWTTTPWTLPANLGLAVGTDIQYAEILDSSSGDTYVLATDRIATYYKNPEDYTLVREYPGSCLVGIEYEQMFDDFVTLAEAGKLPKDVELGTNAYHVVPGHHVTTDSGTGVVHIAPAYGEDDFQIGKRENLGFISHVDAIGHTTGLLSNNDVYVFDYNQIVIDRLKSEKKLVHVGTVDHSYPHCWRCGTPLIYRAISAWYVNVESMKERMIANNEKITWTPDTIKHGRFGKWVEWARDWNISRNRYWGAAIPVWKSEDGDIIVIGSIKELYEANKEFGDIIEHEGKYTFKDGRDIDLHKHFVDDIKLSKDGKTYTRIPEVLDCWFESGSMPYASKHYPFEGKEDFKFPADFIAEGLDQTRGWFYTLLILGTALFDNTPFMNVIVNGLILAEDGKKMSKSLKNYPDPNELINKHGADALRFFMLSSQVVKAEDLRFSEAGVEETVKKVLLPLWNTYSFFTTYANIDGWSPSGTMVDYVRHGQTELNIPKAGVVYEQLTVSGGLNDHELTDEGVAQCKRLGEELQKKGTMYDVIVTTGMKRTDDTARIIADEIGFAGEWVTEEGLRERMVDEKHEGALWSDIAREYRERFPDRTVREMGMYLLAEMGVAESNDDFEARTFGAYKRILEKYAGKRILIVGHGNTFRSVYGNVMGVDREEALTNKMYRLQNAELVHFPAVPLTNPLDRFIISEVQMLVAKTINAFESYDLQQSTRAIVDFMDDLTNWYIRRSRRRFWKSENDGDKMGAYETLHYVLTTLARVMAPITPMIAEVVYRGLTGRESVHLEYFPEFARTAVSQTLQADMKRAREIITLGLALRGQKKIRVRQPLASITIGESLDTYFQEIIREELNVKEVKIEDMSAVARKICKPNAKLIGPRFGKAVQDIIQEAKAGNFEELDGGRIHIPPTPLTKGGGDEGVGGFILEPGEYEIAYEPLSGVSLDVMSGSGMVIAMDAVITEELETEGYARDIVRVIQDLRKEAGYDVSDRIHISLRGEKVNSILLLFSDYITSETLSVIDSSLTEGDISREVDMEGVKVNVVVKR